MQLRAAGLEDVSHAREPYQKAVVLSNYTKDPVRVSARSLGADAVFDRTAVHIAYSPFQSTCARLSSRPGPGG